VSSFFKRFRRGGKDDATPEPEVEEVSSEQPVEEVEQESPVEPAKTEPAEEIIPEEHPEPEATAEEEKPKGGFFARFRKSDAEDKDEETEEPVAPVSVGEKEKPAVKKGFFARIKEGLSRTSSNFAEGLGNLFLGKKEIDEDLLEDIETQLLVADVGIEATTTIIDNLSNSVKRKELANAEALYEALQRELSDLLVNSEDPLRIDEEKQPYVILIVGVNGVGKTTTIGKLTKRFHREGRSVLLAAGDTFRAAAVEQLQVWGHRNRVPVVAQHTGADSASVIFDAIQAAKSRNIDVVIADTAGRLHNKDNLMEELKKVVRVIGKLDDTAPHEVMLVLDAGTGQNALNQAEQFTRAVGVTGLALTKLDGTAKGGVIFAISKQLGIPIRFIGVGEQVDDLRPFIADEFIRALFQQDDQ